MKTNKSVSIDIEIAHRINKLVESGLFRDFSAVVNYSLSETLLKLEEQ